MGVITVVNHVSYVRSVYQVFIIFARRGSRYVRCTVDLGLGLLTYHGVYKILALWRLVSMWTGHADLRDTVNMDVE